jgi:hypothetical protein
MSHIVEAKTSIVQPDLGVLRQALELVAGQQQGTVETFYLDYFGKRHEVNSQLALFTPQLIRGIGLVVNDAGELVFEGDPWAVSALFQQLQQEIIQTYVSLATLQALQQLGYTAQALDGEVAGQVVISGVVYA